jgi:hypothetical protein
MPRKRGTSHLECYTPKITLSFKYDVFWIVAGKLGWSKNNVKLEIDRSRRYWQENSDGIKTA